MILNKIEIYKIDIINRWEIFEKTRDGFYSSYKESILNYIWTKTIYVNSSVEANMCVAFSRFIKR